MSFSKDTLEKNIIYTWRNALEATKDYKKTMTQPFKLFIAVQGSFFLNPKGINAFNKILTELKKDEDIARKFSKERLEESIRDVIIELLQITPEKIVQHVKLSTANLLQHLSQPETDWRVLVPITNLEIQTRFLDVGNVRFSKFAKITEKRIVNITKGKVEQLFSADILPKYKNTTVAAITVSAVDPTRAKELALIAINHALSVLRFYRLNPHFRNVPIDRNNIDTRGRLHKGQEVVLCLRNPPQFDYALPFLDKIGFMFPFIIDAKSRNAIRRDGFRFLSNVLAKNDNIKTDFERRVMSAVHFCSLSTCDRSATNSFVNSMISLEALLIKGREAKSVNVAERVALIVGKDLKQKKWLYDQMVNLYIIRSEIVHEGKNDLAPSDMKLLQTINYVTIVNLLKIFKEEDFGSISDVIEWCKCKKFS